MYTLYRTPSFTRHTRTSNGTNNVKLNFMVAHTLSHAKKASVQGLTTVICCSAAGQAVVQFVVDPRDGGEFAVKFFLQEDAFRAEAALYAACFPCLRSYLSATELCQSLVDKGNRIIPDAPGVMSSRAANGTSNSKVTQSPNEILHPESGPRSVYCSNRNKDSVSGVVNGSSWRVTPSESADPPTPAAGLCLAGDGRPNAVFGEELQCVCKLEGSPADVCYTDAQYVPIRNSTSPSTQEDRQGAAILQTQVNTGRYTTPLHGPEPPADNSETAQVCARFLPKVETMCDHAVDPRGRPLPPCIVMEKGESLQDWSNRAEPDLFTSLAVRASTS